MVKYKIKMPDRYDSAVNEYNLMVKKNFDFAESKKEITGYDGERNKTWIDNLMLEQGVYWVNRDWLTRDGDHVESEDVTEEYED
jgi:hypothetical protein